MLTVWGGKTSRSLRVAWLAEEMGLAYRIRYVDMLNNRAEPAFLAVNPASYIPVLEDGDVVMVESIAIMEYLIGRYGPTPMAPAPSDPAFPAYQQFLHLGEAGLAGPAHTVLGARNFAPESDRKNWSAAMALDTFERRMILVSRQLARFPYLAGETFTAADISVTFALQLATRHAGITLGEAEQAYVARTTGRDAYRRALEVSEAAGVGDDGTG